MTKKDTPKSKSNRGRLDFSSIQGFNTLTTSNAKKLQSISSALAENLSKIFGPLRAQTDRIGEILQAEQDREFIIVPQVNKQQRQIELLESINSRLETSSQGNKKRKKIANKNQFITDLEHWLVTLHNGTIYKITNGEFQLLWRFLNSGKQEVNLMDISITPNIASLNKMIWRLQLKLDNTIKVNKVRWKKLWYLSK